MDAESTLLIRLAAKKLQGKELSKEEALLLEGWLSDPANREVYAEFSDDVMLLKKMSDYHHMESSLGEGKKRFAELTGQPILRASYRLLWQRYVAAAIICLLLAIGAYFWFWNSRDDQKLAGNNNSSTEQPIPPGKDGAILTLAGGEQIVLDSLTDGALAQQGAAEIRKQGARLDYSMLEPSGKETVYNTLTTPRGRQYQLTLPDGSRIWLNAASSVTYPTSFQGGVRKIQATGEIYLEVAASLTEPFIVDVQGMEVKVFGTSFNINAYDNELSMKTTLLEGSVEIKNAGRRLLLKPGQQAQVKGDAIQLVDQVDIDQATAWRRGQIALYKADVEAVLRQISRWYDVEVETQGALVSPQFSGSIPRSLSLNDVSAALEGISNLKFKIVGRKLIVSQ